MKLDDDDPADLLSPDRQHLLGQPPNGDPNVFPPQQPDQSIPLEFRKSFNTPLGVGGNDNMLPGIFAHKPKIDPKLLATPTQLNGFPKVSQQQQNLISQFQENVTASLVPSAA